MSQRIVRQRLAILVYKQSRGYHLTFDRVFPSDDAIYQRGELALHRNADLLISLVLFDGRSIFMPKLKTGTIVPTEQEDKVITVAALDDSDAQPLTDDQLLKLRPARPRGRPAAVAKCR